SGCSNQEVMDVAEYANQPIEFTTFVDKTTRSGDVTSQNFQKFWVFAQNKGTGDQNWADAFTNVQVSKAGDNEWLPINTYYWEKNKEFRFAGYANGESQLNKSIVRLRCGLAERRIDLRPADFHGVQHGREERPRSRNGQRVQLHMDGTASAKPRK
ncbi:fimbrillin family protein, partial [Bacteroides fragilis]